MIAEKREGSPKTESLMRRLWPWLKVGLVVVLLAAGLWYLLRNVSVSEIGAALAAAEMQYIALGLLIMILTPVVKTWRWRLLLLNGGKTPSFSALYWSVMLGQYVNLLVPFLRLGEIARVYALNRQTGISKARSLSTLVVEKTLELIMIGLTTLVLLSAVVLPEFVGNSSLSLALIAVAALFVFYLLAYQTDFVIRIMRSASGWLPAPLRIRFMRAGISGLEGLSSLRNHRIMAALIGVSIVIAILSVLTPLSLFPALNIPFGLAEATLIHVVVSIALAPPTTPGKVVVFDGTVAFLLVQLGLEDEATIISYTILFHLVILVPPILLGSIAASRTKWHWRETLRADESSTRPL